MTRKQAKEILASEKTDEEKVSELMALHLETVNPIKDERDSFKKEAEKLGALQKQLDDANAKIKEAEKNDFKGKYDAEKAAHEKLKADIASQKVRTAMESAYTAVLKEVGVPEKRIPSILRVANFDEIEFDEQHQLKDKSKEIENIKSLYGGLIPSTEVVGANLDTPPREGVQQKNGNGSLAAKIQQEYHESLYGKTNNSAKEG